MALADAQDPLRNCVSKGALLSCANTRPKSPHSGGVASPCGGRHQVSSVFGSGCFINCAFKSTSSQQTRS